MRRRRRGSRPYLRAEGLSKAYGATIALSHVSLDVRAGEVHALLGENGAGKSTLVKILSGIVLPDQGRLEVDGRPFEPGSLLGARAAGVSTAFQELSLLPNLSVAVNLMLPNLLKGRAGINSMRRNEQAAAALLQEFGVHHRRSGEPHRGSLARREAASRDRARSQPSAAASGAG